MVRNKLVYAFLREDDTPFYIGMGSLERCANHKKGSRNYRWWEEMKYNPGYRFTIVDCDLSQKEAWDIEIDLIKKFGRQYIDKGGILTNIHPGGSFWGEAIRKPVVAFDLDGYKFKEWESSNSAIKDLGFTGGAVRTCCAQKQKSVGGYQWFWKSEVGDIDYIGPVERDRDRGPGNNTKMKPVIDVKTLMVYKSKRKAGQAYFPGSTIGYTSQKWFKDTFLEISKEEYEYLKQL